MNSSHFDAKHIKGGGRAKEGMVFIFPICHINQLGCSITLR